MRHRATILVRKTSASKTALQTNSRLNQESVASRHPIGNYKLVLQLSWIERTAGPLCKKLKEVKKHENKNNERIIGFIYDIVSCICS